MQTIWTFWKCQQGGLFVQVKRKKCLPEIIKVNKIDSVKSNYEKYNPEGFDKLKRNSKKKQKTKQKQVKKQRNGNVNMIVQWKWLSTLRT